MGAINRFAPNCCCVPGVCSYQASDGSEYTDTFSGSLDSGWNDATNNGTGSWATSGGRVQWTGQISSTPGICVPAMYRQTTIFGFSVLIAEVDVYRYDANTDDLMLYMSPAGIGIGAKITARFSTGDFYCQTTDANETVSQTPSDGDTLSIILDPSPPGGGNYGACFAINGVAVSFLEDNTQDFTTLWRHGVQIPVNSLNDTSDLTVGEFDNYTSEYQS